MFKLINEIEKEAEKEFEKEYIKFIKYASKNPIFKNVKIRVNNEKIKLFSNTKGFGLFNLDYNLRLNDSLCDLKSVRNCFLFEYKQKKQDELIENFKLFEKIIKK